MKIAVFPGSFDPITNAHVDIVLRSLSLFDKVYVAIGINQTKKGFFTYEERLDTVCQVFAEYPQVEVVHFTGLTVDFCRSVNASYILRGMRSAGDFESERAIAHNNEVLASDVETVFLVSRIGLSHISSTITREIIINKGSIDALVPVAVLDCLNKRDN